MICKKQNKKGLMNFENYRSRCATGDKYGKKRGAFII